MSVSRTCSFPKLKRLPDTNFLVTAFKRAVCAQKGRNQMVLESVFHEKGTLARNKGSIGEGAACDVSRKVSRNGFTERIACIKLVSSLPSTGNISLHFVQRATLAFAVRFSDCKLLLVNL